MVNRKVRKEKKRQKLQRRLKLKEQQRSAAALPFIENEQVVRYVKRSKIMFIMRGLAGSGKSTIVEILRKKYINSVVCSADNFFGKDGSYDFDINLLSDAHSYCQDLAKKSCEDNKPVVIIDNTNVRKWEMKAYLDLAVTHNYVVILVTPKTPWRLDPEELARRNKHGVTVDILRKKVKLFQDAIPLYYGWFLNEPDSQSLLEMRDSFYRLCLENCPAFRQVISEHSAQAEDGIRGQSENIKQLLKYFTRIGSAGILHCTSRFCRWGKADNSKSYHGQKVVRDACGKVFRLTITGLTITPRTIAARVRLDTRQLKLWANDAQEKDFVPLPVGRSSVVAENVNETIDKPELNLPEQPLEKSTASNQETPICPESAAESRHSKKDKSVNSSSCHKNGDAIHSKNPYSVLEENSGSEDYNSPSSTEDSSGKGKHSGQTAPPGVSAHVTLGCASGVRPQQSGPDILKVVSTATKKGHSFMKKLENGVLYYYGEGQCEVCFSKFVEYQCIFSGFY